MLMIELVVATAPAMPRSIGMRISLTPRPCATLVHSSARSRSTRKSEQRSASTTRRAASTISLSRRSRSRSATRAFATSRMPPSFSTLCCSLPTVRGPYHAVARHRMCEPSRHGEQSARLFPPLGFYVESRQRRGLRVALVERRVLADRHFAPRRLHPEGGLLAVEREHAAAHGHEGIDARRLQL